MRWEIKHDTFKLIVHLQQTLMSSFFFNSHSVRVLRKTRMRFLRSIPTCMFTMHRINTLKRYLKLFHKWNSSREDANYSLLKNRLCQRLLSKAVFPSKLHVFHPFEMKLFGCSSTHGMKDTIISSSEVASLVTLC